MVFTVAEMKLQPVAMSVLCYAMAFLSAALSYLSTEMKTPTAAMEV